MKTRVLIIEDEELARELLKDFLKSFPDIEIAGEFADGFSGLKGIQEQNPDIIFLDIQMPKLTGFELLELLDNPPEIIFTTAYDQYAIKAFEHNAIDYLLKPFSEERFSNAVKKALDRISERKSPKVRDLRDLLDETPEVLSRIVVKFRHEIKIVPVEQIIYIEAQDDYVMIYTNDGKYLKQKTMKFFDDNLNKSDFIRVHRSYLVRIEQIFKLEAYEKSTWIIVLKNGQKIPVSRSGYTLLKDKLDI